MSQMQFDTQLFDNFIKTIKESDQFSAMDISNIQNIINSIRYLAENLETLANASLGIVGLTDGILFHLDNYSTRTEARERLSDYVIQMHQAIKSADKWTKKFANEKGAVNFTFAFANLLHSNQTWNCLEGRTRSALDFISNVNSHEGRYTSVDYCIQEYIRLFKTKHLKELIQDPNVNIDELDKESLAEVINDLSLGDVITKAQTKLFYSEFKQYLKDNKYIDGAGFYDNKEFIITPALMDNLLEEITGITKPKDKTPLKDSQQQTWDQFVRNPTLDFDPDSYRYNWNLNFSKINPTILNHSLTKEVSISGTKTTFLQAIMVSGNDTTFTNFLRVVDNKKLTEAWLQTPLPLHTLIKNQSNENIVQLLYSMSPETIKTTTNAIPQEGMRILELLYAYARNDDVLIAIVKRMDPTVIVSELTAKNTNASGNVFYSLIQYYNSSTILTLLDFLNSSSSATVMSPLVTAGNIWNTILTRHSAKVAIKIIKKLDANTLMKQLKHDYYFDDGKQTNLFFALIKTYPENSHEIVTAIVDKLNMPPDFLATSLKKDPELFRILLRNCNNETIWEKLLRVTVKLSPTTHIDLPVGTTYNTDNKITEAMDVCLVDKIRAKQVDDKIVLTSTTEVQKSDSTTITLPANTVVRIPVNVQMTTTENIIQSELLTLFNKELQFSKPITMTSAVVSLFNQPTAIMQLFLAKLADTEGKLPSVFINLLLKQHPEKICALTALARNPGLIAILDKYSQIKELFTSNIFKYYGEMSLLSQVLFHQDTTTVEKIIAAIDPTEYFLTLDKTAVSSNKGAITNLYILAGKHFSIFSKSMPINQFDNDLLANTLIRKVYDSELKKSQGLLAKIAENELKVDINFPILKQCIDRSSSKTITKALTNNFDDLSYLILNTNDDVMLSLLNKTSHLPNNLLKGLARNKAALSKLTTFLYTNPEKIALFDAIHAEIVSAYVSMHPNLTAEKVNPQLLEYTRQGIVKNLFIQFNNKLLDTYLQLLGSSDPKTIVADIVHVAKMTALGKTKACQNLEKLLQTESWDADTTTLKALKILNTIIKADDIKPTAPVMNLAKTLRAALLPKAVVPAAKSVEQVAKEWVKATQAKINGKEEWTVGFFRRTRKANGIIPVDKAAKINLLVKAAEADKSLLPNERDDHAIWQKTKFSIETILIDVYHNKTSTRSQDTQKFYDKLVSEQLAPQLTR